MNEGIGWTNELAVTIGIERVAGYDFAAGGQLGFGAGPDERPNPVSALEENGNESGANVAGSSRDEHAPALCASVWLLLTN